MKSIAAVVCTLLGTSMGLEELSMLHSPSVVPAGWKKSSESVDKQSKMEVTIGVKRDNSENIAKALRAVSDPESESYLQYPTAAELAKLSQPSAASVQTVKDFVRRYGMDILSVHPDGDYITCRGTLSQIEEAAHGEFDVFYHTASGAKTVRISNGVKVPKSVADSIDTFTGFHSFPLTASPKKVGSPSIAGAVTPKVIRSTYGIAPVPKSGKQNIQAIAEFQGQYVRDSDLKHFCDKYNNGVNCKIEKYIGKNDQFPAGVESMLDTEYITSIGNTSTWVYSYPNVDFCNDLLVFTANVSAETTNFPYVISISYGSQKIDFCPSEVITRLSTDFQKLGLKGISVMISSGDDGSGGETRQGSNDGKLSPAFPASIPYVTAVGSTYFVSGVAGEQEATTQFGSGGGFSYDYPVPDYQSADVAAYMAKVKVPSKKYATSARGNPDTSFLGESFTVVSNDITMAVGGTSASSPSFAGVVSLLNEICLAESGKPLGFLNPFLYKNPTILNDITKGTNAIGENKEAGWEATAGWDACTGLGTPNFPAMVAAVKTACKNAARRN
eukprot:TRINITY_DN288_c0_g1_i2.p1 TRINITY_DN288_c0_g1~~TRINITY_DN288_c0_g1_i2.p1  ORF type:complete len:572 (+),score=169.71 TRINITY_DN288_c0_g1_i2:46-1716(+)